MATETLKSWSEVESDQNENFGKIEDTMRYIDCVYIGGKKEKPKIGIPACKKE